MKKILYLLIALLVLATGIAQEKKNYKPLTKELNKMLKQAEEFSWMYEGDFEIVTPYKMSGDTLSVTIRGITDGKPAVHKYQAYLPEIKDFARDIYFILRFKSKAVKISELRKNKWVVVDHRNIFHLGKVKDEESERWEKILSNLLNELFTLENNINYWD